MTAALSLSDVSVSLGGRAVVRDVTLDLPAGRFVALVGPNGAGKTTLLRAAAGLVAATGAIAIAGAPLAGLSRPERARAIAYLPQGHQVHWPLAARDVVALGRYPHGLADPSRMGPAHAAAIAEAMARTDTAQFADRPVQALSGGERARVMLARVFAVGAGLILADEPTAALDPRHQIAVMRTLKAEAGRGALVLAATHDLTLAGRLADLVVLMAEGRVVASGPPREVLTEQALAEVYGVRPLAVGAGGETALLPWELA